MTGIEQQSFAVINLLHLISLPHVSSHGASHLRLFVEFK